MLALLPLALSLLFFMVLIVRVLLLLILRCDLVFRGLLCHWLSLLRVRKLWLTGSSSCFFHWRLLFLFWQRRWILFLLSLVIFEHFWLLSILWNRSVIFQINLLLWIFVAVCDYRSLSAILRGRIFSKHQVRRPQYALGSPTFVKDARYLCKDFTRIDRWRLLCLHLSFLGPLWWRLFAVVWQLSCNRFLVLCHYRFLLIFSVPTMLFFKGRSTSWFSFCPVAVPWLCFRLFFWWLFCIRVSLLANLKITVNLLNDVSALPHLFYIIQLCSRGLGNCRRRRLDLDWSISTHGRCEIYVHV